RVAALVIVGHRTPPRQVPPSALVEELDERIHVGRVESVVSALHDRHVFICCHVVSYPCRCRCPLSGAITLYRLTSPSRASPAASMAAESQGSGRRMARNRMGGWFRVSWMRTV